jgi:hypothetical protein
VIRILSVCWDIRDRTRRLKIVRLDTKWFLYIFVLGYFKVPSVSIVSEERPIFSVWFC